MPFTSVLKRGYFLEISKVRTGRFQHTLGGKSDLPGAVCHPCGRPLLLMMSLDVRDPRLNLKLPQGRRDEPLDGPERDLHDLPLLYCWSCGADLDYRLSPNGGIDVLNHTKSRWPTSCLPYDPYPESFPRRDLRLVPIPPHVQRLIRKNNAKHLDGVTLSPEARRYLRPALQVGGEPVFVQKLSLAGGWDCTLCGGDSPFLAAVADPPKYGKGFHDNSYLQVVFHWRQVCQVLNAYHECD